MIKIEAKSGRRINNAGNRAAEILAKARAANKKGEKPIKYILFIADGKERFLSANGTAPQILDIISRASRDLIRNIYLLDPRAKAELEDRKRPPKDRRGARRGRSINLRRDKAPAEPKHRGRPRKNANN